MLFFSGFIYCVYGTSKDSKTAYFIITSRAWEMLLGGVAFLYPLSIKDIKIRIILQNIGFFLILYSCFFISDNVPWPGYMAIIPVLGAYLVVLSNNQNNIFINNVFFRYIGKWSYSIYVWHWPFVILGVYFSFKNWWVFGIVFSIIIGFLSYQFIEKIKFKKFTLWKEIFKVKPFYIFLVVISCGYAVKVTDGFKSHYSKEILNIDSESKNSNPYKCDSSLLDNHEIYKCKIGNQGNLKAIVVGDSHADALTTSVSNNLNLTKQGIVSLATSGCPFVLNANFDSSYRTCPEINEKRVEYLKNNPQIPIIINRYLQRLEGENDPERISRKKPLVIYFSRKDVSKDELYREFENNLKITVCSLTKKSPVYIVLSIPEVGFNVPERMSKQLLVNKKFDDNSIEFSQYEYRAGRLNKILVNVADTCGAKILNPTEILCRNGKCITQYNGRSIYRDSNHLSEYGNKLLSPMFKKALTE